MKLGIWVKLGLGWSCIKRFHYRLEFIFGPKFPLGPTVTHRSRTVHTQLHQSTYKQWTPSAHKNQNYKNEIMRDTILDQAIIWQTNIKFCMLNFRHRSWARHRSWTQDRNSAQDQSWTGHWNLAYDRIWGRYQSGPKTEVRPRTEVRPKNEVLFDKISDCNCFFRIWEIT